MLNCNIHSLFACTLFIYTSVFFFVLFFIASPEQPPHPALRTYFPHYVLAGNTSRSISVYITKDMWWNAFQTTLGSGLNEGVMGSFIHVWADQLWSDLPWRILISSVSRVLDSGAWRVIYIFLILIKLFNEASYTVDGDIAILDHAHHRIKENQSDKLWIDLQGLFPWDKWTKTA